MLFATAIIGHVGWIKRGVTCACGAEFPVGPDRKVAATCTGASALSGCAHVGLLAGPGMPYVPNDTPVPGIRVAAPNAESRSKTGQSGRETGVVQLKVTVPGPGSA